MASETKIQELRELARRLDSKADVQESTVHDADLGCRVSVSGPNLEPLEVRSSGRTRARQTVKASLVEQLGERGLLRCPEADIPDFGGYDNNQQAYKELSSVLDGESREEEIQKVITRHPGVWQFLTATKPQVIPKMPLGGAHVTDFVVFGALPWSQTQRPCATFVEIERADVSLFNAKGDPSAALTHGQRQLRNWRQWIKDNKQQVRDYLVNRTWLSWERHWSEGQPGSAPAYGFDDRYLLVIGRRTAMTPEHRWQLHQICEDFPRTITYDMLLDALCPEAVDRMAWIYGD